VIKRGEWAEINPINPVTNEGPYEFRIPPDPHMLQMGKNYIYMQLQITYPAPAPNAPAPVIAPINLIGKTFFRQVKLYLNGRLVSDSGDKYAYRSFLETELNFGYEAKNSHLKNALYTKEAGGKLDTVDNEGFKERVKFFTDGKVVEVLAPVHIDLFMQDKFLLKFVELKLELWRNSNDFVLQCPAGIVGAKLEVKQIKFYIRKVEVLESVSLALEQTMNSYNAKYPIRRVLMMNMHIPSTSQSTPLNTLYSGQLPRRIIIGCIDGDAYRGNIKKSPFNFKCYSINEVRVVCGGVTFPSYPVKLDFENDKFLLAYNQLYETLDLARDNKGNALSRKDYKNGACFFAFDLTPDEDDSGHWDLIREGSTSVEVTFSDQIVDTGIEVVVYMEFDNLILIDKNRNIFYDYST